MYVQCLLLSAAEQAELLKYVTHMHLSNAEQAGTAQHAPTCDDNTAASFV